MAGLFGASLSFFGYVTSYLKTFFCVWLGLSNQHPNPQIDIFFFSSNQFYCPEENAGNKKSIRKQKRKRETQEIKQKHTILFLFFLILWPRCHRLHLSWETHLKQNFSAKFVKMSALSPSQIRSVPRYVWPGTNECGSLILSELVQQKLLTLWAGLFSTELWRNAPNPHTLIVLQQRSQVKIVVNQRTACVDANTGRL